jgi:hypothetical protein
LVWHTDVMKAMLMSLLAYYSKSIVIINSDVEDLISLVNVKTLLFWKGRGMKASLLIIVPLLG